MNGDLGRKGTESYPVNTQLQIQWLGTATVGPAPHPIRKMYKNAWTFFTNLSNPWEFLFERHGLQICMKADLVTMSVPAQDPSVSVVHDPLCICSQLVTARARSYYRSKDFCWSQSQMSVYHPKLAHWQDKLLTLAIAQSVFLKFNRKGRLMQPMEHCSMMAETEKCYSSFIVIQTYK